LAIWLMLTAASRDRVAVWHDTERLWTDTLAVNPASTVAHNNLGIALSRAGRIEEAEAHFVTSLHLDPGDTLAEINLGVCAARREAWADAIRHDKQVLRRAPGHPLAWNNLGAVAAARGQDRRAEWFYRRALAADANDADTQLNLGTILVRTGR